MSAPRVGVLALQGDVREHLRMLAASGAEATTVRRPSELDVVDALVVPGGESTTIDKLSRAFELRDPIRERIGSGMPVLGTCAGMILLADRVEGGTDDQQTFGGMDVTVRRNAFGRQVDSFETDLRVQGLDDPLHAVFIRGPWVESHGPGVEVLAAVDRGDQGRRPVVVRQGALLAASFHPELGADHRLHQMFVRSVHANGDVASR
ncbi:pyridoxal 5'-phosphate synthase glutaminase subunit PdxT [Mumia sp. zg.B53]|uniref:pyridoxal 5'-phosphate synthase glutaminase subunit PdxT n=1 Tax=Mumia sp. zg.B53 TaxID=2855449 RepID=UPI001C6F0FA1|nr:pyridoxal 5'-phosphate synthase glutaminase subunit PdxT [Mumia sp. zg.B53]MBW9216806.1 pyridoxal 5'-phosphate synthase glutaminase subunit PdxT [Mumia sp. zg.B53]